MARPRKQFDLAALEKLGALNCTNAEIGTFFHCSLSTIEGRIARDPAFREVIQRGRALGRIAIRRAQMAMMEAGNATMGIWLGKQLLGQRDVRASEVSGPEGKPIEHTLNVSATDRILAQLARIRERAEAICPRALVTESPITHLAMEEPKRNG